MCAHSSENFWIRTTVSKCPTDIANRTTTRTVRKGGVIFHATFHVSCAVASSVLDIAPYDVVAVIGFTGSCQLKRSGLAAHINFGGANVPGRKVRKA